MIARVGTLLRRLLGEHCIVCGLACEARGLCNDCPDELPRLKPPLCPICAEPVASTALCGRCLRRTPHYDHVIAAREYAFPIDAMLQQLKYQGNLIIARGLGALLGDTVRYSELPDLIVPMPLAARRLRERGFNQAHEIARCLPLEIRSRRIAHVLERVQDTPAQTQLTLRERAKNLRNAFRVRHEVDGARIAIVDDVMTTGATLDEAARMLKSAGAAHVAGWVVARTVAHRARI